MLADRGGLAAVTIRGIASQVNSSPPGLYRYVANRDELIDLMVDHVTRELQLPQRRTPWRRQLIKIAVAQRDTYQRHPWLIDAARGPRTLGPHGTRLAETYLQIMEHTQATTAVKLELLAMLTGLAAMFAPTVTIADSPFPLADPEHTPHLWTAMTTPTGQPRSAEHLFQAVAAGIIDAVLAPPRGHPKVTS